jgi:release factor glutamine methyltransferase
MTCGAALRDGAVYLRPIADAPHLEAQMLLTHVTGRSRTDLLTHPDYPLPEIQRANYQTLVRRRAAGFPLPYLTGRIEFYGLDLVVTPDVLIPRPETETLVDRALEYHPRTAVDVGTGSGCVAIALAVRQPGARVYATDLSAPALRVAADNVRRHEVQAQLYLVHCDLVGPFRGPFDLVISNPPYVATEEWPTLPEAVRRHEPRLALDGGPGGLRTIRRLLTAAPRLLKPGGVLLIEIGAAQGKTATALARTLLPLTRVVLHRDLSGCDRVLEIQILE